MNYCPPGHRCIRICTKVGAYGWRGVWGSSPREFWVWWMWSPVFWCIFGMASWRRPVPKFVQIHSLLLFCFLTYWGSDFTRLGLQGPLIFWARQAHSVIHPCSHATNADSNAGRHSSSKQVYWSWHQNHLSWIIHSFIQLCHLFDLFDMKKKNSHAKQPLSSFMPRADPDSCTRTWIIIVDVFMCSSLQSAG